MVGYTESLTDPSYRGQILVLTAPLVGNYGVPSEKDVDEFLNGLPKFFESRKIYLSALVVGRVSEDFSHYLAKSSLGDWMKAHGIPGISGVDTRKLTKIIRTQGSTLARLLVPNESAQLSFNSLESFDDNVFMQQMQMVEWDDPNGRNLVKEVSTEKAVLYPGKQECRILKANKKPVTILAVDVGMKYNQIRCFTSRGVDLKVVPWDYDFTKELDLFDGLFISNGPGDPTMCKEVIERIKTFMSKSSKPIFGICLGHQLLALASGAKTQKMKFGNRGHNIPCTDMLTGRCYITSQNHGYAVDAKSLSSDWMEYFVNANDGSNEGIIHKTKPFFSVQFHPESTPGPRDTEVLFDKFIRMVLDNSNGIKYEPVVAAPIQHSKVKVRKVLILGSGGLSIGQAGEFDYSGSQAIKALKEEGIYTVLINPNIATIQTSKGLADKVYFLPVTPEFVRKVIQFERPDGIYVSFGGQTALNCGVKMKDEFEELGVKVLGTSLETVMVTEDRELFARKMEEIDEKCAKSASATNIEEAIAAGNSIGFPLIVRAAYALGGLGSGFASNQEELKEICDKAFAVSPQVLIEKSMKGWKEIEYEVVRDAYDNCITVCNMENFDPLGIHTGDSIVVAPSQTLSDEDYNMLRSTAVKVIRHLKVVGECNIQYALNPDSKEYCIIEVNARLSRSSALASKATGYPLAFVAAKLGLGVALNELKNSVTKNTCACFEPSLDYVVVKIPRWDLKKFNRVSTKVGSAMKSVGEVMAIGRNFEETIQKAIRCVDYNLFGLMKNNVIAPEDIDEELTHPSDQRLFAIANALHLGYSVEKIWELTKIDRWFLKKLQNIVKLDQLISTFTPHTLPKSVIKSAKELGFSDRHLAKLVGTSEMALRKIRVDFGLLPYVKQIDTVAAEFPCFTNYLYMTYNASESDVDFEEKGVMVLGSGVYRIGSSVEFDWCAVRTVRTLRSEGFKTIMVNYNPETVSTDYDEADRLYFENITLEKVLDIYELEKSSGVVVSVGGQTPNNIALSLYRQNVKILGTSPEQIDGAENRYKFSRMLDSIGVDQPKWKELTSLEEAKSFCESVGYPVLVRPSYVLSGAAMNVVYTGEDLENFLLKAVALSSEYPVVITKFIEEAKEIEMDAVAKDGTLIFHVISEHVENAGVHSGDATLVLPPQDLEEETVRKIEDATAKIADNLNVTGPMNIQFIAKNNEIKVIECNLRASRSFPFVSKVMGVDMIDLVTKVIMGIPVETPIAIPKIDHVAVKVPQFSFSRLSGADPILGVEMASTGEVACFGKDKYEAYMKALLSTGITLPKKNILLSIGSFKEKQEFLPSVWKLHKLGFIIYATTGTGDFYSEHGIPVKILDIYDNQKSSEYNLNQHLEKNLIDLYINLPSRNRYRRPANYMSKGYKSRRMAVDHSIPLITNIKCAKVFVEALSRTMELSVSPTDCQSFHKILALPGLIDIAFWNHFEMPIEQLTKASLASGFTVLNILTGSKALSGDLKLECDYLYSLPTGSMRKNSGIFVLNKKSNEILELESVSEVSKLFQMVGENELVIAQVTSAELASLMFLASMHKTRIHVTNISSAEDLKLIQLAKMNGNVDVTCDMSMFTLFNKNLNDADLQYLWSNLSAVDCLSTNVSSLKLGEKLDVLLYKKLLGIALTLILTAVYEGKITTDDVMAKLYENPCKIFGLPKQSGTIIEVELDRPCFVPEELLTLEKHLRLSNLYGCVSKVFFKSNVVYVDGFFPDANCEKNYGTCLNATAKISVSGAPKDVAKIAKAAIPAQSEEFRRKRLVSVSEADEMLENIRSEMSKAHTKAVLRTETPVRDVSSERFMADWPR
jgi:carbamoyl-phosphate synthase/aspartate carbamoyltransferase